MGFPLCLHYKQSPGHGLGALLWCAACLFTLPPALLCMDYDLEVTAKHMDPGMVPLQGTFFLSSLLGSIFVVTFKQHPFSRTLIPGKADHSIYNSTLGREEAGKVEKVR